MRNFKTNKKVKITLILFFNIFFLLSGYFNWPIQFSINAFLTWDFLFRMKRFSTEEQCIRGATHIRFANDGRVEFHRDYWDAAEELYEKLPVLGALMRGLKRMTRN